jgi:hypothetical protein
MAAAGVMVAASATADTKLVTDGSPARILVPADGNLGGTWRAPSFNDSSWIRGSNGVGYEVVPGAYNANVIADSRAEWSAAGRQGENHWINGYYDKTGDLDATYQATDFQPFPRSEGPFGPDNFWTGGAWDWFAGDPPWDTIGAIDVHPNGINNAVEHWVIRRWSSTAAGPITLRFHLRKSNLNGTGVTGKIFKNGAEIFTRAIAGGDGTGFEVYVNTTAAIGDVFDFVHTPVGPGGDETDGADGSIMTATVLSGTVVPPAGPVVPVGIADSSSDWSSGGVQGANGWFYGYYNRTADADGTYNPNVDFNTTDPNWTFTGGTWQLGVDGNPGANPPWDTIGATDWHPNGDNQPQGIHWVIRRWVCEVDGDIYARVRFAKANVNGNGTTLHVLRTGVDVYSITLNNTTGIDTFVPFPDAFVGDKIEFALDPLGTDGLFGDGSDTSTFSAAIFTGTPPQTTVADSVADWSATGVQGANGWYYGSYNETTDADHVYDPNTDFNTTDPNWTFGGNAWTLGPGDPPWDIIGQTDWHPNGDNNAEVHWVIRRWVSDVDGDLHAAVQFGKQNINGGNGTTLRILHNGTQVFSRTVAGTDGTGINTNVNLPDVFVGDKIEFALDPLGTDGTKNDGADGSFLRASILTGLAPEPPKPFVPGIADTFTTDLETAMKGVNPSVFIRIPFDVANPALIETLKLKMKYNDGFVAYLNGTEIIRRNTPTSIAGLTVADSIADWSTNPDVTVNGWSYGYYDQSLDADGTYSGSSDFTPFPHDGGGYSATDFWTGSGWDWFNGNPPWTELFQEGTHPNNPNGGAVDPANPATHLHWTIRRWSATVDANLKCRVRFRKTNTSCGDGVRVEVFHNSARVYSQTIAFNDSVGRDDTIDLPDVFLGDNIDVLLGPGDGNDFCDGSAFSAVLFEGEPTIPWNGAATASRTTTETIAPEVFDISSFIPELRAGANVLAIQGFNAAVNDNEFVINAQLLANKVPTAVNDTVVAAFDTPATYPAAQLLANDSDSDGDKLLLVGVTPTYATAQGGTVRLFGDTVRYTPPAGYSGPDSFNYTISDGGSRTATALVQVNVVGNTPPVAVDDTGSTAEDTSLTIGVLANDTDADGDSLAIAATTLPAHGTVVNNGNGTVSYTPASNYNGPDSFNYTVSDGKGGTDSGTVNITVTPVNDAPLANADSATTPEDAQVAINILANDSDPDGDTLTTAPGTAPAHGVVFYNPTNQTALYRPNTDYNGPDSFTYRLLDGKGGTASGTVSVTVLPVNDPPVAQNDSASTDEGAPVTINVLVNDSDPDGDTLAISAISNLPLHGTVAINGGRTITYTPTGGFTGADGFTYHIVDGNGGVASALVSITVRPHNAPPVADASATTLQVISPNNSNAIVRLDGTRSSDPDGDTLTYSWYADGSLVPIATGVVADALLEVGEHSIALIVGDGQASDTDTIQLQVITAGEAVEELISTLNQTGISLQIKRPLIATMKAAVAALDRGQSTSGANQLVAFQNKVRAQVGRVDADLARSLIEAAQEIIDALQGH